MMDHDHLTRHEYHKRFAVTLAGASPAAHAWACVIGFYAAYHSARWGLQCDGRFDDLDALKQIHPDLIPDDRRTAKHKARRRGSGSPDFGVNDLVLLLYPDAARPYELLHQASIEVRYNEGRSAILPPAQQMLELVDEVHAVVANTIVNV